MVAKGGTGGATDKLADGDLPRRHDAVERRLHMGVVIVEAGKLGIGLRLLEIGSRGVAGGESLVVLLPASALATTATVKKSTPAFGIARVTCQFTAPSSSSIQSAYPGAVPANQSWTVPFRTIDEVSGGG
jgi:hypothetical protein